MIAPWQITRAADRLRRGGVVAFPTETVYGLGANAFDRNAIAKVFQLKGRPRFDPLIVHVEDVDRVPQLVGCFSEQAQRLARAFWPGSLSIVLPKHRRVPDLVTAGLPTVAVRVPDHDLARQLIEQAATAIAAPSANRFGSVSPTTADHVRAEFGERIDLVLDGGPCHRGVESTVISLVDQPTLLRPGGIEVEAIEQVVGPLAIAGLSSDSRSLPSPGMLRRHYAPRTPMRLVDVVDLGLRQRPELRVGLLLFVPRRDQDLDGFAAVEVLSSRADLAEAAANLFAALRRLDAASLDSIIAERVPDQGLGRAINDRLMRGSMV